MELATALVVALQLLISSSGAAPADTCAVTLHPSSGLGDSRVTVYAPSPGGEFVFKPGGAGFVGSDGSLGIKVGWQRGVPGRLTITGRRLDEQAPALRSEVNSGYGDIGFQASYVIFPTPGCWEITGSVGEASVTFVMRVVKIGDGPTWHRP